MPHYSLSTLVAQYPAARLPYQSEKPPLEALADYFLGGPWGLREVPVSERIAAAVLFKTQHGGELERLQTALLALSRAPHQAKAGTITTNAGPDLADEMLLITNDAKEALSYWASLPNGNSDFGSAAQFETQRALLAASTVLRQIHGDPGRGFLPAMKAQIQQLRALVAPLKEQDLAASVEGLARDLERLG